MRNQQTSLRRNPLLLLAIAAVVLVGLVASSNAFEPARVHAQADLAIEGSCEPAIRPNETALVYCTVTLTNNGDEAATDLSGSVFIAEGCQIPSRFAFIDRTLNEGLVRTIPPR